MPKAKVSKRVPRAKPAPQDDLYSVRLTIAGNEYVSTGTSVLEALTSIQPPFLKSYGVFTVTFKDKTADRRMFPAEIKKLLRNATMRQIFDKRMNLMLK